MDEAARAKVVDGKWELIFSAKPATAEPQTMLIEDSCGNTVTFEDVLVGDVWVMGGQSNNEITLNVSPSIYGKMQFDENRPIRLLMQSARYVIDHQKEIKTAQEDIVNPAWKWARATRSEAYNFSALGYLLADTLNAETGVPVGVICVAAAGAMLTELMPKKLTKEFNYRTGGLVGINRHYNALTAPFHKIKIKGYVFFQGEAEAGGLPATAYNYGRDINALFTELRYKWGFDFPIYNIQLCDYSEKSVKSGQCAQADIIRAQQFEAYKKLDGVRLIPSYDLGPGESYSDYMHSPRKKELADRLAKLVLADVYGKGDTEQALAPEPVEITLSEDETYYTIKFANTGDGLVSKGEENRPVGFGVGSDLKKLTPASAEIISKDTVKVFVPLETGPSGLGYACKSHLTAGDAQLYNSNDLPVPAFFIPADTAE
jgi:sialate O-acetylesterase